MNHPDAPATLSARLSLLLRRLAALAYDLIVLGGLLVILTFPYLGATVWLSDADTIATGDRLYQSYLAVVVVGYFFASWRFGGQTVGMRAWRLYAADTRGHSLSWQQGALRAAINLPGLLLGGAGYWWALADAEGRTAGERWSSTFTYHHPKPGTHNNTAL